MTDYTTLIARRSRYETLHDKAWAAFTKAVRAARAHRCYRTEQRVLDESDRVGYYQRLMNENDEAIRVAQIMTERARLREEEMRHRYSAMRQAA